jgi:ABC transporter substrate binding protein (PQQ-dependent alcohol dehydrogenase system)
VSTVRRTAQRPRSGPITFKAPDQVAGAVTEAMTGRGIKFFLIDAPAEAFKPLAAAVTGRDVMLFNVSAPDDSLRREPCAREMVHAIPSLAMSMDALMQYLVSDKWRDLLVVEGPLPADAQRTNAFPLGAEIRRPHGRAPAFQDRHRSALFDKPRRRPAQWNHKPARARIPLRFR